MNSIRTILANNLQKYRNIKGLSQEGLASKCGLHRTYISQIERSLKSPTIETVQKFAIALEIDICTLLTEQKINHSK